MRPCVLFNPVAGGRKAAEFRDRFSGLREEFDFRETTSAGSACRKAKEAVEEGCDTLVAVGGDGTFNEVLNGVGLVPGAFERVRLGVLPLGTANVFAKELDLPLDLDAALSVLRRGHERTVDLALATCTEDGREVRRYFGQLGGAGLDVQAIEQVNWESKKRFGSLAYIEAGLKALNESRQHLRVSVEDRTLAGELVLIGNGRYYGGRFEIFTGAHISDGLLHAAVFQGIRWSSLVPWGWGILTRTISETRGVSTLKGRRLRLESEEPARFQLEGDLAGHLPCTFEVIPGRLRVIVPDIP